MRPPHHIGFFLAACLLVASCSQATGQGSGTPTPAITVEQDGASTLSLPSGDVVFRVIRQGEPGETKPALIIGLHGYGQNERQMQSLVNVEPEASNTYISVRGFSSLDDGGYGWFPISAGETGLVFSEDDLGRALDRLVAAAPALAREVGADPDHVFFLGYSQGATLSMSLALRHPDVGAGFVAFAGALLPNNSESEDAAPTSNAPVLIGHGTRDPSVRAQDVDRSVTALADAGRQVELQTFDVPHVVSAAGRRAIATWIDGRLEGAAMPQERPEPLSLFVDTATLEGTSKDDRTEAAFEAAVARGAVYGNLYGDVTIHKFFDYNCPVCKAVHRRMDGFLEDHPNVRVVAVDVPVLSQGSKQASAVTFEIDDPETYYAVYNALMGARGRINAEQAIEVVNSQGVEIDGSQLEALLGKHRSAMRENVAAMTALGIEGTPGFLVTLPNGERKSFTGWKPQEMVAFID